MAAPTQAAAYTLSQRLKAKRTAASLYSFRCISSVLLGISGEGEDNQFDDFASPMESR